MSSAPGKALKAALKRMQRRHPRYRCEFPVMISLFSGEGRQQLSAHCRDLSQAGVGALVAAELKPGDVTSLRFKLPGLAEEWEVRAVLRHRRGFHYGFEFLSLAAEQSNILRGYLASLQRADTD